MKDDQDQDVQVEAGEPEDTQVVQNDDEQEDGREAVKHMEDSEETGVIDGEETLE